MRGFFYHVCGVCAAPCKSLAALMLFLVPALHGQVVNPVPGFLLDASGQLTLPNQFLFEQQIQAGIQGNDTSNNPFDYWHAVQIRPWLHYDGIRNLTLTAGLSYIDYFNIPGSDNYAHHEWRVTAMATLNQRLSGGSLYEQVRYEWLDFADSHGTVQHLPRLRLRAGQNLYLGEGRAKPYIGLYEEAIMQFPDPSYSRVRFEGARFFFGYGCHLGRGTTALVGLKAAGEVSSSGSAMTLYFGPAFSVEYNFSRDHAINENHRRTTAFKDF